MNILIAPDSFKGTLSSTQVAEAVKKAVLDKIPTAVTECIPIADGGEGIIDCFKKILDGETVYTEVTGPNFQKLMAPLLICGKTAVVEMAAAAGLPLADPRSAGLTTTYGVGELIAKACELGAENIFLGLGGSATNDGGAGMAAALGTKFYNKNGEEFIPTGFTLCEISDIKFSEKALNITALCDVRNPMFGENGAAYIYVPQKGASPEEVKALDDGLRHLADILTKCGKADFDIPGSGAAGALGAGVIAFTGGKLKRGIDAVLDAVDFDKKAQSADYIITGEGSLDSQSFCGKVIDGIIARSGGAKVIALVGISKITNFQDYGLTAVFETNCHHLPFTEVIKTAEADLTVCAGRLAKYLAARQ
ncbi:MAG: glycerate kinase [Clostridiales bacterium]|nr:glycerate kinase [Clostridiales bacterium]